MKKENFVLKGKDELELYGSNYETGGRKGSVVVVHGMAEHRKRYDEFACNLANSGYSVYTYDQRGHGETARKNDLPLGHLEPGSGWEKLLDDVRTTISFVESREGSTPTFLLGHSMGSFVTRHYVVEYGEMIDGLILSGTGRVDKLILYPLIALAKLEKLIKGEKAESDLMEKIMFASHNNDFEPSRTKLDWLTRDEEVVDKYLEDELAGFSCTTGFYDEFVFGLTSIAAREAPERLPRNLRLLLLVGENDPVGGEQEIKKLAERFGEFEELSAQLEVYEGARHELLHEINREEVIKDTVDWLDETVIR